MSAAPPESASPARIPIEPGFFTIPESPSESPRLLGSRCDACGEPFFPRRVVCARCLGRTLTDVELGPHGTLYTFTGVHVPLFGSLRAEAGGYGVGQVDLDEGPRVQAVLSGEREQLRIGMQLALELETLRRTPEGQQVVIFRFAPVSDSVGAPGARA